MMSPSGLKSKLIKMANSIALGRTLQPRTSQAEVPLGSSAPGGAGNALEYPRLSSYVPFWGKLTHHCKHAHTPEGANAGLTGSAEPFLLFRFSSYSVKVLVSSVVSDSLQPHRL